MEISVKDLFNLKNPKVIDIRSIQKYNDNHIPGAINIPSDFLISNPDKYLDRNLTYYIYCQKGITSRSVVLVLKSLGYNAFSVSGGYEAYVINKH